MKVSRSARALCAALALLLSSGAEAVRKADVRNSKHNLSATSSTAARTVTAVSETQICAFCHTPHGATRTDQGGAGIGGQLWNRTVPATSTYVGYTSSSLDAATIQAGYSGQPGGSSKLCLSCHDGTLAVGSVNVLNGAGSTAATGTVSVPMTGGVTTLPGGTYGASSGYSENLGTNLTNDHPISVTYDNTLALRDGELRGLDANQKYPATTGTVIGKQIAGYHPLLPLEPTGAGATGQVQCSACHDPHLVETDTTQGNQKFLRTNRFQVAAPTPTYNQANDIICLACHDKNGAAGAWAYSVHGNSLVATQTYTAGSVTPREFPANLPVWKASCLNCHDTHTVQGARHLLREGTDAAYLGGAPGAGGYKQGGNAALEETCYQCHTSGANSVITPMTGIDDIQTDFAAARRMPIKSTDQPAGSEVHDIGGNFNDATFVDCTGTTNKCGADGIEQRGKLGVAAATNRHAECTDCHNPHRVVKFQHFNGNAGAINGTPDASATHTHTDTAGYTHDNIASGVLRGAWGVEPTYPNASFQNLPSGYTVKRGDPGTNASTAVTQPYVTREYQVCLKCHSDYGYSDNNAYPTGTRPNLGSFTGGTPTNTNGLAQYTNQAKEFQAPAAHQNCENPACSLGTAAGANVNTNNHRSWHPVMAATGRTQAARRVTTAGAFLNPWNTGQGTQTMYCDDCHGSATTSTTSVIPNAGNSWGPHGSANDFLMKGRWTNSTAVTSAVSSEICLKCHNANMYNSSANQNTQDTGFWAAGRGEGHGFHYAQLGRMRCNWCHVAVPHGWKNKALLVNLNDVGPEVGLAAGTNVGRGPYTKGPYYMNAYLKINSFKPSGQWSPQKNMGDCDHGHGNPP